MNEQEVKKLVDAMNGQGASQEEIQRAISARGSQSATPAADEKVGFTKGVIQSTAKPFLKVASSAANIVAAPIAAIAGKSDEYARAVQEGMDYGFFGKVTPFGTQMLDDSLTVGQKVGRTGMELAGNMAEIASYGFAPLKGLKGAGFFETAFKAGWKPSVAIGAGKALEAGGEGKSAGEAITEGVGAYIGSSLGFGVAGKGAQLMGNWGAKALQSKAIQAAGEAIKDVSEKIWQAMPESFQQKGFDMAEAIINSSTRRAVNAAKSEYAQAHKGAIDAWIGQSARNVDRPDLALGEFQRSIANETGAMFKRSASLYDDFKAGNPVSETASDWVSTNSAINKLPKDSNMRYFFTALKQSLGKPTSPRQVLGMYEQLMQDVQTASTNEEKTAIREVANSLYSDMRSILEVKDKSLLNKWDEAYQSWKSATDAYSSNPITQLKTVGQVDTAVDSIVTNKMSDPEKRIVLNALAANPGPTRELFVSSLLRKVKGMEPTEGAKTIRDFLDNWDIRDSRGDVTNTFLDPKQAKYLDDLASYMEEDFSSFTQGMRKAVGITDDVTESLAAQKGRLDIAALVDKGDFGSIADNFIKQSGTADFAKNIDLLNPAEKRVVGLSIWRDMFEESTPLMTSNPDGTVNMEPFAEAFRKSYADMQKVGGGKKSGLLEKLYSEDQIAMFNEGNNMLKTYKDFRELPKGDLKTILHGVLGSFYLSLGGKYVGAAARHAGEAVAQPSRKVFYQAIDDLVERGMLQKNWQMTAGEIINMLGGATSRVGAQGAVEVLE